VLLNTPRVVPATLTLDGEGARVLDCASALLLGTPGVVLATVAPDEGGAVLLDTPKTVLANVVPDDGGMMLLDICIVVSPATSVTGVVLANVGADEGATGLLDFAMLPLETPKAVLANVVPDEGGMVLLDFCKVVSPATLVTAAVELLAVVVVGAALLP